MKTNLLLLSGGTSQERQISIASKNNIQKYINSDKYNIISVSILPDSSWVLENSESSCSLINENGKGVLLVFCENKYEKIAIDIIFPVLHGDAEDGGLLGLFEAMNLPYVGTKKLGSVLCFDKLSSKKIAKEAGISVVPFIDYYLNPVSYSQAVEILGSQKLCIKPSNSGSSLGVSVAYDQESFLKAIAHANEFDEYVVVEKYIQNVREIFCGVLFDRDKLVFSKLGKVKTPDSVVCDWDLKYSPASHVEMLFNQEDVTFELEQTVGRISLDLFKLLRCHNYCRVDFLLDENDQLYFSEANTIPGLGQFSFFLQVFKQSGYEVEYIVERLLENC